MLTLTGHLATGGEVGAPEVRVFSRRNVRPRILAAARAAMRSSPGTPPAVQDLAALTGLSRRAIYNHFARPQDIYKAVLKDYLRDAADAVEHEIPRTLAPEAALERFVGWTLQLVTGEPYLQVLRAVVGGPRLDGWLATTFRRTVRQPLVRSLEAYLLYRHLPASGVDPADAAECAVAMIEGAVLSRLVTRSDPAEDWEMDYLARVIAAALLSAFHEPGRPQAHLIPGSSGLRPVASAAR